MNRIRHSLARRASSPGTSEPHASQPPKPRTPTGLSARPRRPRRAVPAWQLATNRPAPAATASRRRTITVSKLLPRTIQLCIHCRRNPAGFWVSRDSGQTVRRPWCLSCCQNLDPGCCHVQPFDS